MLPRIHLDGEVEVVDLDQLEEDVRRGRVPARARLHHPPLTGDRWVPLSELPRFREALEAPDALLAARVQDRAFPWLAWAVTLVVTAFGALQLLVEMFGPRLGGSLFAWAVRFFRDATLGVGTLVFDGRPWTAWTSQLTHSGPMHLLPNLAVVGYAGHRLQKVLGADGYALVAASTILVGALSVAIFQDADVMGASMLGYGLWAGVIVAGFRFEEALPQRVRRYYGFGSLPLFAVLFIASLDQEGVAHAAHLGGFAGGAVATMLVRPAGLAPPALRPRVLRRNLLLLALLLVAPAPAGWALSRVPWVVLGRPEPVRVEEAGVTLDLPPQLQRNRVRVLGRTGWTTGPNAVGATWCELSLRVDAEDGAFEALLARELGAAPRPAEPLAHPPGEGWRSRAWRVVPEEGTGRWVERHLLVRGRWVLELGMIVRLRADGSPGPRARVFRRVIESVVVHDPPELARAEQAWRASPASPARRLALGRALLQAGRREEAEAHLRAVAEGAGPAALEARRELVRLWREAGGGDPALVARFAADRPDRALQAEIVRWYDAAGRCDALAAVRSGWPEADRVALAGLAERCADPLEGAAAGPGRRQPGKP